MDSAAICNTPNCDVREQQNDNPMETSPLIVELQQPAADSLADSNREVPEEIPENDFVYETPAIYQDKRRVRFKRLPLLRTNWRRDLMQRPLHTRLLLPSLDTRWKRNLVRRLPLLDTHWKRAFVQVKRLPPQRVGWIDK